MSSKALSKYLSRAGAVLVVAVGASACSSVPDWVDPTTWVGGDDSQASSDDQTTPDDGQTPDLSTIPAKPTSATTPDEQKAVSDTLSADRSQAEYSGDNLRGGTDAAAAAPPAAPPPSTDDAAAAPPSASDAPPPAESAPPISSAPGTLPSSGDTASAANTSSADASPAAPAAAPSPASDGEPAVPAGPSDQVASVETAPAPAPDMSAGPAVPAVSAVAPPAMRQQYQSSDAALGFKPSSAPPLDPSVAQFVAPPIMSRYRQTASLDGEPAVGGYSDGTTARHRRHNGDTTEMANAAPVAGAPATVVFFRHDTTILDASARAQVRAAASAFLAQGGQGYVRVVGHASAGSADIATGRHQVMDFEHSQARANAVARAMIAAGIPANHVLVSAVGDQQPLEYDAAPAGVDPNHSAEIFFQN